MKYDLLSRLPMISIEVSSKSPSSSSGHPKPTALVNVNADIRKLVDVLLRVAKVHLVVRVDHVIFLCLYFEARIDGEERPFCRKVDKVEAAVTSIYKRLSLSESFSDTYFREALCSSTKVLELNIKGALFIFS